MRTKFTFFIFLYFLSLSIVFSQDVVNPPLQGYYNIIPPTSSPYNGVEFTGEFCKFYASGGDRVYYPYYFKMVDKEPLLVIITRVSLNNVQYIAQYTIKAKGKKVVLTPYATENSQTIYLERRG
jgi:hypothetical protein